MRELQAHWEQLLESAAGLFLLILVLTKGLNRLLLWADAKDWILIPNRDAVQNAEARFLEGLMEIQALVEPAKRHVIDKKTDEVTERAEDDKGDDPDK